jgi:hypothetical protein
MLSCYAIPAAFKGYGLGYFRLFLIPYFSGYISLGRQNEHYLEIPAYAKEDYFIALYKQLKMKPAEAAKALASEPGLPWGQLLKMDKKVKFGHMLWNCTPGV